MVPSYPEVKPNLYLLVQAFAFFVPLLAFKVSPSYPLSRLLKIILPMNGCDCARIRRHNPSYEEFYREFLLPNIPVVFSKSLTDLWPARQLWTAPNSAEICWDYLLEQYGDLEVAVANCADVDSLGNQERDMMRFREVLQLWKAGKGQSLYVKDWHLAKQLETAHIDPVVPPISFVMTG